MRGMPRVSVHAWSDVRESPSSQRLFFAHAASKPSSHAPTETARTMGDVFLKEYLLPFEVASLVLLATMIGAVVIARKEIKE